MKLHSIHNVLINRLKENTPLDENTVDILMDITPMSKEAAYRRLRGEIPFSTEEAIRICRKLNLSLDEMARVNREGSFTFYLNPIFPPNPLEEYYRMMTRIIQLLEQVKENPHSFAYKAQILIPLEFVYKYKLLNKHIFFKWIYQLKSNSDPIKFSDVHLPQKIYDIQKKYLSLSSEIKVSLIIDNYCFSNLVRDIKFFSNIGLISAEEVIEMKKEIHSILNDMESAANKKLPQNEFKLLLYITHTFFDASYIYIQNNSSQVCALRIYGINNLFCENTKICEAQKVWIESLIRYSTLISGSGELIRFNYFKKQREIVDFL